MYGEAVEMLYSCNTLIIADVNVLVDLAKYRLLTQRLHAIKHLEIRWEDMPPLGEQSREVMKMGAR